MKRREEGRCFQCGLAFGLGHRCPEKSLRVIILAENEKLTDDGEIARIEPEEDPEEVTNKGMGMSMCSAGGLTQPQRDNHSKPIPRFQPWGQG